MSAEQRRCDVNLQRLTIAFVVQPVVALTIASGSGYDTPLAKHFCAKFVCPAEKISTQKQPNSVAK